MSTKLQKAEEIFLQLGWDNVTVQNLQDLPLGTPQQKKTALEGLKNGEWGEIAKITRNSYTWRSFVTVDTGKLAVFAVCAGVTAQRAAVISYASDPELLAAALATRGPKYAEDFIRYACVSRRRMYENSTSVHGLTAVLLADRMDLAVPQQTEYMKDWAVYAAAAMGLPAEVCHRDGALPPLAVIQKRFLTHIETGIGVNTPATGPFGTLLPEGVRRGWITKEQALPLVFLALDGAARPGDRKVWLELLDTLGVTAVQLVARAQSLIPLLALGEAPIVERLAPVLLPGVREDLRAEVLLACLSAKTKKSRQMVLQTALACQRPAGAEDLIPWLSELAQQRDKSLAGLAGQLMDQWQLAELPAPKEMPVQHLWQKTPPVWTVPAFDLGPVTPQALTQLAAELTAQADVTHDVKAEQFLALANALAYRDAPAARTSLQGLRPDTSFLERLYYWVKKQKRGLGLDQPDREPYPLVWARDVVVCLQLEHLPCLLSTPSRLDLSIDLADLVARLETYHRAGVSALEADLLLALTRLDGATQTPELLPRLQALSLPVLLQSGKKMARTAGQIVLDYLQDPFVETPLTLDKSGWWQKEMVVLPASLADFPLRFNHFYQDQYFAQFPLWGDGALRAVHWSQEVYPALGLVLRQVARRRDPLPPGGAMNMLAALRSCTPGAEEDCLLGAVEAFQRGLLRPGVADVAFLDWCCRPPSHLALLAQALGLLAREGLLSVIWPLLDSLLGASLQAPRLLSGTAEVVQQISDWLAETQYAVQTGLADSSALDLPHLRALAARTGSSQAVLLAKQVAAQLPLAAPPKEEESPPPLDPPFAVLWPPATPARPILEDGAQIQVDWVPKGKSEKLLRFTLTYPDFAVYVIKDDWVYDLEMEGQCQATRVENEEPVWLHWDKEKKAVVTSPHRNWRDKNNGPLKGGETPLPRSLQIVVLGLLAQDGSATYHAPHLLEKWIEAGEMGTELISQGAAVLLQSPAISPAKLTRVLEKKKVLLPHLWPLLTHSIALAGTLTPPPAWASRVLDVALHCAPYLAQAAQQGLILEEWPGLAQIAASPSKSASVEKAKKLSRLLHPETALYT